MDPMTLPRATPESVGMSSRAVAHFLDAVEATGIEVHSFMLFHVGHVVAEGWWAPYRADLPHMQHSLAKSFTATAVGLAIAEGVVSLDDPVVGFFPDAAAKPDSHLAAMTIRHLLTMTTGHRHGIGGEAWRPITTSWTAEFFKAPVVETPGTRFVYSSAASYMLSAILQRVTGQTLHDYLEPRLFQPLGIVGSHWTTCPNGVNPGGNGLSCRTEDILKLGILHLQGGRLGDRQVLPKDWVAQVSHPTTTVPDDPDALHLDAAAAARPRGYGMHWWTAPGGIYYASGLFGQYVVVFPEQDAVVAFTAALRPGDQRLLDLVWRDLAPGFGGLPRRLGTLRLALPEPGPTSPFQPRISDRWFRIEPNEDGVTAVMFAFEGAVCRFVLRDKRGEHTVVAGLDRWMEGTTTLSGAPLHHQYQPDTMRVSAAGSWRYEQTFVMTWVFPETAFRDQMVCRFSGYRVTLDRSVNVNSAGLARPTLFGRVAHG